ncbi:probable cyclin-dependent kinase 8 [Patiria miniata]|uniref:non-specific serine/threonine protein kinase n=1 Tax=Patiria miniata TaxID=46514 RepID=A0A914B9R4_PATMI|nr:probable cyclin-dependent kinase 8 [Patiria miniata]
MLCHAKYLYHRQEEAKMTLDAIFVSLSATMNRYTPVERLCSGYYGSDHRVRERRPGKKERRVKLVPCGSREFALRALSVYRELAYLPKHENVAKVKEAFLHRQQGTMYLCSVGKEYGGQTLNEFLLQKHSGLTDEAYKTLFLQITSGLSYLHSNNIAHNTLTPFSVVMTEFHNGNGVAKLTDYGLAQLCLQATDDCYDLEEGRSLSLMYALPPEAYQPTWGREFDKPNRAADIFMLGMLFNAVADHSLLPVPESQKKNTRSDNDNQMVRVFATVLPFPGYGSVPVGKFLHSNPSVDLDRQLFRTVSPDLRRLLRRMALLEPNDRPAPTGVIQMLNACKAIRKPTEEADDSTFKMPLAPFMTTTNRKRRSSSIPFDPTTTTAPKKNRMAGPAKEWEKATSEAASSLIRRASLRLSQRAKSVSDFLNQKKSMKITD